MNQSWSQLLPDDNSSSYSWYDQNCDYIWPNTAETVLLCFIYSLIGVVGKGLRCRPPLPSLSPPKIALRGTRETICSSEIG